MFMFVIEVDWFIAAKSRYKPLTSLTSTWADAHGHCSNIKAKLVSLETLEEFELIESLMLANFGK